MEVDEITKLTASRAQAPPTTFQSPHQCLPNTFTMLGTVLGTGALRTSYCPCHGQAKHVDLESGAPGFELQLRDLLVLGEGSDPMPQFPHL